MGTIGNICGKTGFPSSENQAAQERLRTILGVFAVFASAFFFYFSTVVIRWSRLYVEVAPGFFAFVRFVLGFFVVCGVLLYQKKPPKAVNRFHLINRSFWNTAAVYCFYMGVIHTSVAEANILNMTYPVFIALITFIFVPAERDGKGLIAAMIAFLGIWLVVSPKGLHLKPESLWGLVSGITAAFAIIFLNLCRRNHDTDTILFYMFGLGTIFTFFLFHKSIFLPSIVEAGFLLACGASGIIGQYLITLGFRYVTAVEGGIISSMRILLAAVLGPYIALDPPLTLTGFAGAFLIFSVNVYITLRKAKTRVQI